jgi:hypothetical protein
MSASVQPEGVPPGTKREPQYSLLTASIVLLLGLAALTLIPHADSSPDLVGFHTLCSFAPASTLILLALAGFARVMRDAVYKSGTRV